MLRTNEISHAKKQGQKNRVQCNFWNALFLRIIPQYQILCPYFLFTETRLVFENHFEAVNIMIEIISRPELGEDILGLQPRDKAAMLVVNKTELFHE